MRNLLIATTLILSGCGSGQTGPESPPAACSGDLWIVTGQSNTVQTLPFSGVNACLKTTNGQLVYESGDLPGLATHFYRHLTAGGATVTVAPAGVSGTTISCWQTGATCFEAKIAWLAAPKGVLWWQGESDAFDCSGTAAAGYEAALRQLIADWRTFFGNQNLPFYVAQLGTNGHFSQCSAEAERANWAAIQAAQAAVASDTPNTYLIQTTDVTFGDDVHPKYAYDEIARRAASI